MTDTNADLAQLIGSRICHDLISPIGAISNGIELIGMSDSPAPPSEELALIEESCRSATARIRFYRVAFGTANGDTRIGARECRAILADLSAEARIDIEWRTVEDLPRIEVQLAFLAVMCFETALPRGGEVVVTRAGSHWRVATDADMRRTDPQLWSLLTDTGTAGRDVTPAEVQFRLLADRATAIGRGVSVSDGAELALSV